MHHRTATLAFLTLLGIGCDDGPGPMSADASTVCASDIDCHDGVFCNGRERCAPESPSADARGCVAAALRPCPDGVACNEDLAICGSDCSVEPDQDGDGHDSIVCGGDDCDDFDATRFPGNPEVCDAEGHDDDCDPRTLGDDMDGDGFVAAECCNTDADGRLECGGDCDDDRSGINPGTPETCNEVDDDCNGLVDDGLTQAFFEDRDGDGFGVESSILRACVRPEGYAFFPGDCNDESPTVSPVGVELCDGIDSNCSSGGGVDLTEDADGDGFAPPGVEHCIPLETERDCADSDARAFPGQTEFFAIPICAEGRQACRCTQTLTCHPSDVEDVHMSYVCIPAGDSCAAESQECLDYADQMPADWDFDCDGEELRAPNRTAPQCASQPLGSCNEGSGYGWPDGCNPAQCGDDAAGIDCFRGPSGCNAILGVGSILPCR
ncbi:MAG: putative metal-binding motif-containing protein [Deltaproteobacteria bacterium]|nr:putative metal-binding motif-containing protein [Deltaproteobacteria bacterium]